MDVHERQKKLACDSNCADGRQSPPPAVPAYQPPETHTSTSPHPDICRTPPDLPDDRPLLDTFRALVLVDP
eukprot:13871976-Alexandrium_andersonii.AAC.1